MSHIRMDILKRVDMARHKEFEPEKLLDQAMYVFWQKGYHDTSLDDLVEATGVQRYGIYATFKNKHGLLLAALDHYHHAVLAGNLAPLTQAGAGLEAIQETFQLTAQYMSGEFRDLGCFMCNTAMELAVADEAVAQRAANYGQMVTNLLRQALVNAQQAGQISAETELDPLANFLFGALIGIPTFVRVGQSSQAVQDYIQAVLSKLG